MSFQPCPEKLLSQLQGDLVAKVQGRPHHLLALVARDEASLSLDGGC